MPDDYAKWLEERDLGRPFTEEEVTDMLVGLMEKEGLTPEEAIKEFQAMLEKVAKKSAS